jgi:hypothetical protein
MEEKIIPSPPGIRRRNLFIATNSMGNRQFFYYWTTDNSGWSQLQFPFMHTTPAQGYDSK